MLMCATAVGIHPFTVGLMQAGATEAEKRDANDPYY